MENEYAERIAIALERIAKVLEGAMPAFFDQGEGALGDPARIADALDRAHPDEGGSD